MKVCHIEHLKVFKVQIRRESFLWWKLNLSWTGQNVNTLDLHTTACIKAMNIFKKMKENDVILLLMICTFFLKIFVGEATERG